MARFVPSRKTENDFNDGEKYINKIDVVQADTANNLVEAVLYMEDSALLENSIKIITRHGNYAYETEKHTAKNPAPYPQTPFPDEFQEIEMIITANNDSYLDIAEGKSVKLEFVSREEGSELPFQAYSIDENYNTEHGVVIFDKPINYEEEGITYIKIRIRVKWNEKVPAGYNVSVDFTETKKTPLPYTESEFLLNNNSEIKFNGFDSSLETPNRLVIEGTRINADTNPVLSGDITMKSGTNIRIEQVGHTLTFNSETPSDLVTSINGQTGDITLADVAISGSYKDLKDKPAQPTNLAQVAYTGKMEDLTGDILQIGTIEKGDVKIFYPAIQIEDPVSKQSYVLEIPKKPGTIAVMEDLANSFVTIDTNQTITGHKTFTGGLTYGDWQTLGIGLSRDGVFVYAEGTAYKIYFPQKEGTVALEEDIPTQYVKSVNGRSGELMLSKSDLGLAHALLYDEQKLTAEEQKQARDNLGIGDVVTSINGKTGEVIISKNDLGLGRVAITNDYNDLDNKPSIPTDYVTRTTGQTVSGTKTFTSSAGIIAQDPSTNEAAILTHGSLVLGIGNKSASSSSPRDYLSIFPTYIARAKDQGGSSGDSYAYNFPNKSGTFALQEDIPTIPINHVTTDTQQVISGVKTFTSGVNVKNSSSDTYTAYYGSYYMMISHNSSEYQVSYPTKAGALALTSDIKSYTQGTGVSISSSNVISTTAASSTASGHVTTGTQTFAGRKTFNGGINIPSGATIQLNGSSGTAGYVLTSNGTSSAPSWQAVSSGSAAYPIGAYYISHSSTSPAILFGGSWTSVTGKFLYCNAGTSTGGSNTHTLTVNEMPSHNHNDLVDKDTNKPIGRGSGAGKAGWKLTGFSETSNFGGGIRADNTGGGSSFSIMPAYQSCYAWRRTA